MLPSLFVSHGAPTFPLTDAPARNFLEGYAAHLPEQPKAILVVSAHWEAGKPTINAPAINPTIHDFHGFPAELYRIRYPAAGSVWLADRVTELLSTNGTIVERDMERGLDHGAWVPLSLMFPAANIPVAQLSVETSRGAAYHYRLGQLLAPLRNEDVLIIGSGSFTHDLSSFREYFHALHAPPPQWVNDFAEWMTLALEQERVEDVLDYRERAPFARRNHPTEEHLLPLFVAMGAANGQFPEHLHASTTHGVLRMDAFAFGETA